MQKAEDNGVSKFLSKLDDFDLNEYIKVIKFDELKVPSVPFQIPSSKTYFGIKEMMYAATPRAGRRRPRRKPLSAGNT